jgi:threonyl-tRNA synthetase
VPYQIVIGDKEVEAQEIAVRTRKGTDLGKMSLETFTQALNQEINSRSLNQLEE